jgi:hypothetical protein
MRPRSPGEGGVDDAALEIERGAVAPVEGQVIAGFDLVAEQSRVPLQLAHQLLGVGIEEELVRIEAVASSGLVRTMHAISVNRAVARPEGSRPDFVSVLGQADAFDLPLAAGVEQAELDLSRVGGEQGEIHPQSVPRGAKRIGQTFRKARGTDRGL